MPKWCKLLLGILLLPTLFAGAAALVRVAQGSGRADTVWVAALAGAACWLVIYWLLPKPMLVYVFGHELTHAIWVWLFGGRVKKFKASAEGGHVVVTRTNFLISLAPYFFPLYALLVAGGYAIGARFWNLAPYAVWFHLLLGAAYAFHVTLTFHILQGRQSDIVEHGYLFSMVVIGLGNLVVLLAGISLLGAAVDVPTAFRWWWQENTAAWLRVLAWCTSVLK